MPTTLQELRNFCDETLEAERFSDYCPNGLQVEGRAEVRRLACAVTANQAVIEQAAAWDADALLVHHGYFWRGEAPQIVGMKRRRLLRLLESGISLLAYHLPLDAHPTLGNNAQLGARLGIRGSESLQPQDPRAVGNIGSFEEGMTLAGVVEVLRGLTGLEPLLIGDPSQRVERVAWCTGAAQGYLDHAVRAGAELYISGEVSEQTFHEAQEQGIAYIAAGHHATERYGVQALAGAAAEQFGLDWQFLDSDNPV